MKRKTFVFLVVLVLAALLASVAFADGNPKVVYTWTLSDLGQGVWGGGPLFNDGTTGGNLALSLYDDQYGGQVIAHFHPISWNEVVPGESVDICFSVHMIQGPDDAFPPGFCFTDVLGPLPVTGTPIIIPNPDIPDLNLLIRVTPAN